MEYKVGQIYFLVGAETAKVIPYRIVEEVTRTTLEGIEKSYIAEMPNDSRTKVEVEKLKGHSFNTLADVKTHMMRNASEAIDKMISDAEKLSSAAYGVKEVNDNDIIKVDIGNGVFANMKASDYKKMSV
jgi:hypothetical protein